MRFFARINDRVSRGRRRLRCIRDRRDAEGVASRRPGRCTLARCSRCAPHSTSWLTPPLTSAGVGWTLRRRRRPSRLPALAPALSASSKLSPRGARPSHNQWLLSLQMRVTSRLLSLRAEERERDEEGGDIPKWWTTNLIEDLSNGVDSLHSAILHGRHRIAVVYLKGALT